MPENIADIVSVSADIPEIQVLRRLARERRIRFGIRGGVIRNLLVTFHEWEKEATSLFRFVDAFSDIDMVVTDERDWPPLWQAIAGSVPFAGFFRWEATSFERVLDVEKYFEHILVDRFVLWFDGNSDSESEVLSFGFIGGDGDAQKAWKRHLEFDHPAVFPPESITAIGLDTAILALLKLERYQVMFGDRHAVFDDETVARESEALGQVLDRHRYDSRAHVTNQRFIERLDFAILDLLFSARRWTEAQELLNEFSILISQFARTSSPILNAIANRDLAQVAQVGASVYRPAAQRRPRRRLHFERRFLDPEPSALVDIPPSDVIPWTPVTIAGPPPCEDCCRHRDFELGSGVVAWRSPSGAPPLPRAAERLSAVARLAALTDYPLRSAPTPTVIPLPGIAEQTPAALVVRFDHGYVRARAARGLTFELGVREESAP